MLKKQLDTNKKNNKFTLTKIQKIKNNGDRFAALTAYDYSFAKVISDSGIEVILVGDSLGMTIQGHKNTLPVTINNMIYHTKNVIAGAPYPLIMVDMPFATYSTEIDAIKNAALLMQAGAEIIKIEGKKWVIPIIKKLTEQGIPVCAHFGLTPQFINQLGGFKVQGRNKLDAEQMIKNAILAQEAGAKMILLECIINTLAKKITQSVKIPVIGIGSGKFTNAQILVIQDILGLTKYPASFTKNYLKKEGSIQNAIINFSKEVKNGNYPELKHSFEE